MFKLFFSLFLFISFVSSIEWSPRNLSPRGKEMKEKREIVLLRVLVECQPPLCLGRRRDWREAFAQGMRGMTQLDVFTYDTVWFLFLFSCFLFLFSSFSPFFLSLFLNSLYQKLITKPQEGTCTSCETLQKVNCEEVLKRNVGMVVVIGGGWEARFRCTPFKKQLGVLAPLYGPKRNMTVSLV